jgi:hypothetical protein
MLAEVDHLELTVPREVCQHAVVAKNNDRKSLPCHQGANERTTTFVGAGGLRGQYANTNIA